MILDEFGTAIINAGGKSLRMGYDKAFIKCNGIPLVEIIIDKLKKCFENIILVTNDCAKYNCYSDIIVIEDEIKGVGPVGGLYSGLKVSKSKYNFLIACDMPVINYEYIKYMKQKFEIDSYDAVVTRVENRIEPFHGFYNKDITPRIKQFIDSGKSSFHFLFDELNALFIYDKEARYFERDLSFLTNINNRNELNIFSKKIRNM